MGDQGNPKKKIGCLGVIGIIVGIIILISIIFALSGNGKDKSNIIDNNTTEKNTNQTTTKAQETEKENKPKIEFSNIVMQNQVGLTTVIGEAKNNDSKAHSFTLKVSFYDKDNKLLGTAVGAMNDLNGGETKVFSAMATEDYSNASSYKVQVDTIVSSTSNKKTPIEFSNIVIKSQFDTTTVDGEAKNIDTKDHSFTVVVAFYDKNKKLIGSASGAVNDLAAGDTKTFSAMSIGDYSNADSYKVQVDTLID